MITLFLALKLTENVKDTHSLRRLKYCYLILLPYSAWGGSKNAFARNDWLNPFRYGLSDQKAPLRYMAVLELIRPTYVTNKS